MLDSGLDIPTTTTTSTSTTSTSTTSTTSTSTTSTTTTSTTSTTTTSTTSTTTTSTTSTTTTSTTSTTTTVTTSTATTATTSTTATTETTSTSTSTSTSTTTTTTSTTSTTTTSTTSTSTTSTTSTSTTSTTTTTTASVPLTVSGAQNNFDVTGLPSGWTLCYYDTYNVALNSTVLDTILTQCNKGKLLLGCGPINSSVLTLAAMGLRSDVLYNCGNTTTCTHTANGVGWYYSSDYSWGFVENQDTVFRNRCDVDISSQGSSNSGLRLCWHTGSNLGGYRCGSSVGLNSDTTYARYIYHVD
ncbi:unnamed protein product [Rotaria sordida]|uniref:Uncharacterized protein n=1 Tax=Rotaria sordida TaxID=392033 RepID=A0A814MJF1_9BILA|nr:unnamed protein product [Rotaria sordida]CAF1077304.1 unnamed protein product [Rotaria sordida]CAF1265908.1 unnamed protein product [Rotaria sordida]